jgi:3-deoxy-D-manno-octulosonic-acid transferase
LGIWNSTVRIGHAGRATSAEAFGQWATRYRDSSRPLVLFHAPSAGEARQAEAVMMVLRRMHPEWQQAFTFFSPSATSVAAELPADVSGYLPYDRPRDVARFLDQLRPTVLVFTKLDLWPELATAAQARGIPVALISATVRSGSSRLRWPARVVLRPGYAALDAAGAADELSAERLVQLGAKPEVIRVLGDPRYDSVAARVAAVPHDDGLLGVGRDAWTIVAGSVWPADVSVVLAAFELFQRTFPASRLVLVPHQPTAATLRQTESSATRLGLPQPLPVRDPTRMGPVMYEDRIGTLLALYGAGRAAYVGGGFGTAGLHSVLEPAAWGVPVTFGPLGRENVDAERLLRNQAATLIEGIDASVKLAAVWDGWMSDETGRAGAGRRALAVVQQGLGAAGRCAELIERLVTSAGAPRLQTSPNEARLSPG